MPTLLLVDDDPGSLAVMYDLLLPDGYLMKTAKSGAEALDCLLDGIPDVIITDIMMPRMDGFELCRRLRAAPLTKAVPIVVVTALGARSDMARAIEAGATDFISKPVSGVEVRARVRSMVRIAGDHRTLQQLLTLRTDLTNMVVHDLRNPLMVILLAAATLQRMLPDCPEALHRIQRQVVRLQQLIDDLLVIAKSEAGVVVAKLSDVDADALAALVLDDCGPVAETAHIALHSRVTADGPLAIDVALIRRCLENLVLNAIKFSPPGTTVSLDIVRNEAGTSIDVSDEGPGVPEAIRESLFERFVTGAHGEANVSQTGLGLAFSRMAVEAHGGTIAVNPRPLRGSIFRIELPPVSRGERAG